MHTSHYSRLENRLYRLPPKKDYPVYILHAVPITTHTHDRRKSSGKNETKKEKMKERKGKKRQKIYEKMKKGKKRKYKKSKKRKNACSDRGKSTFLAIFFFSEMTGLLGPFFSHSRILSVENGLFRLKPKSGPNRVQIGLFLHKSKNKRLFRLNFLLFFDLSFSTGSYHPVEKLDFFDWICQSKNSVEKVLHLFFEPIASLIPPQKTHPHAHTSIPGTTHQYHTTAPTLPWLSLLLLLAASQRGALLAPLASSVYHTTQ